MSGVINHIGLSSGKDSTVLWGWALNDSGYDPATIRGSFADTENEYQEVYDQIRRLSDYGVKHGAPPVVTLHSMGFLNLAIKKHRFPAAKARFCTEKLKIIPARNYVLSFEWLMGCSVLSHSGVRASESTERSMMEEYGEDTLLGVRVRRPILKWSLDDVWQAHKRYGLPVNPLYRQGRRRVGCRLCCMSNKQDVRITAKHHPEVIDEYRRWEKLVGESRPVPSIASFFPADTIPEAQRTASYTNKDGKVFSCATIDDVVRWSKTMRGGVQNCFDFIFEEDDAHLPCQSGYCE